MSDNCLVISDHRVIYRIPFSEIVHVESKGMRCFIYTVRGEKISCSKNMGAICEALCPRQFFRIATSVAINLNKVIGVRKEKRACVILSNGLNLPIAKRRKSEFFRHYAGEPA